MCTRRSEFKGTGPASLTRIPTLWSSLFRPRTPACLSNGYPAFWIKWPSATKARLPSGLTEDFGQFGGRPRNSLDNFPGIDWVKSRVGLSPDPARSTSPGQRVGHAQWKRHVGGDDKRSGISRNPSPPTCASRQPPRLKAPVQHPWQAGLNPKGGAIT